MIEQKVVINIKSRQYIVSPNSYLRCDRLHYAVGEGVEFPILYSFDGNNNSKAVKCEIIKHTKGKKVIVFHKTRRNGDSNLGGCSKPHYTIIKILDCSKDALS